MLVAAGESILNVIAIGGSQQFSHFIPIAGEISRRGRYIVRIFVPSPSDAQKIYDLLDALQLPTPEVIVMTLPSWLAKLVPQRFEKLARLLFWATRIRSGHLLVCAERTSTLLKRIPGACPPLLHIPHGAGDRAVGFEKRFSFFDKVLVAGEKDRDRLLSEGVVRPEQCAIGGPVKIAAMLKLDRGREPIFSNDLPTILYNPHFKKELTSAQSLVNKITMFVAQRFDYNLVIAPHVRFAERWTEEQRKKWTDLAVPGRIIIDLGSPKSIDMSYTLGSDIYVGDVSSQVYEFLIKPRPCVFVNAHNIQWQDDESFAMWKLGEVIQPDDDLAAALKLACMNHASYEPLQKARLRRTLEGLTWAEDGTPHFRHRDPMAQCADILEAELYR